LTTDAIAIETPELEAWLDMYRAMPRDFRTHFSTELIEVDKTLLTRSRSIPFVHFNAVLNLGLESPASEAEVDAVVAAYQSAGIARFAVFHHPLCQPADLPQWLQARGCQPRRGWDRVYRFGTPPVAGPPAHGQVVFVTADNASAWARLLDRWYKLPTSPWLMALVGRDGWRHAMLLRDGQPVATRSMFVRPGRDAWFGVEAPIPGLMAPSFEDDWCLLHALLMEAAREDVLVFAGDVEASNEQQTGPAYDRWRALGFTVAYHRTHYVYGT